LFVQLLRGSDNPGDLARNWLNASTTSDGIRFPVISGEIPAPAASAIYQDSLVPIASDVMSDSYAANPVSRDETWPTERTGILSRLAASGVARPLWPSSYQLGSDRKVAFGYCIPTASPDVRGKVIEHAEDVLEDPLHAVLVQLATLRLFSSIETRTSLLVHDRSLSLKLQSRTWEWEGSLIDALKRLLSIAHLEAVESEALPIAWQDAVHIALENLARLRVLVFSGPRIDPAKRFVSLLSASPRHPANRPEKGFRARLSAELPQLFANRGAA
jgi:hypothetical protein